MKFDSPLFDRIRVRPDQDRRKQGDCPACEWPGCRHAATHRAPKGRLREGEYWRFCLDHVRDYNQSYNFFAGMSEDAVARFQKEAVTGHRPTWKMGVGRGSAAPSATSEGIGPGAAGDPFGVFRELGGGAQWRADASHTAAGTSSEGRIIRNAERKALDCLGLEIGASPTDIKGRFKVLVKRHHPDANGGDRSCEDRLREIIQAYNYLKSVGFC